MVPAFLARLIILCLGYLFPAFNSYKAIRDKNTREYVKWMMYWVVFSIYCFIESFADVFVAFWCPFYQELKILTVIWFLAPATRGSSYLYRHFVHPFFNERAAEIDSYLSRVHRQGIVLIVSMSSKVVASVSATLLEAVLKFAPQLAFGAAQVRSDGRSRSVRRHGGAPRSVLTASSRQAPAYDDDGHGDEGDGVPAGLIGVAAAISSALVNRPTTIGELSDVDDNESAVTLVPPSRRRQPQLRRRPGRSSVVAASLPKTDEMTISEEIVRPNEPLISDDESDNEVTNQDVHMQDEDVIELSRSESVNSFEREFFPRGMLPSPSEEDVPGTFGEGTNALQKSASTRSVAKRGRPVKATTSKQATELQPTTSRTRRNPSGTKASTRRQ